MYKQVHASLNGLKQQCKEDSAKILPPGQETAKEIMPSNYCCKMWYDKIFNLVFQTMIQDLGLVFVMEFKHYSFYCYCLIVLEGELLVSATRQYYV